MDFAVDIDALVSEAANGSSRAFAELVRLHQSRVRFFLARFTPDSSIVDDLAQEVFLTAYRKLGDFGNQSKFSTWLMGIAKNKALGYLRSESRRKNREEDFFAAAILEWQSETLSTESEEYQSHYLKWLEECLDGLTPNGKEVIEQHYFQSKSCDEVGAQLNKGGGAIRMMLVRIRRALLKCLTKKKNQFESESES